MVHLNVRGLLARDASAVAQAVDAGSQDIMVFTETWLRRDAEAPEISGFTACLNLPRSKKLEKRTEEESATKEDKHPRGGIAVYLANTLAPSVSVLLAGPANCYALLRIDGVVGQNEDAFLFACYMPPQGSPAYGREGGQDVWKALTEEVAATVRLGHVFVVGDLNARTATCPDFPGTTSHPIDPIEEEPFQSRGAAPVHSQRHSRDNLQQPNSWGRKLLDLCICTSMRIANGRVRGDEQGQVTFISSSGRGTSLVDYALASPEAMYLIEEMRILPAPETDHSAVQLFIQRDVKQSLSQAQQRRDCRKSQPATPQPRCLRGTAQLEAWQELLRQDATVQELYLIQSAASAATCADDMHAVGAQFDALIERTQAEVLAASPSAKGRRSGGRSARKQPAWWDKQLADGRRAARQAIRRDPKSHAARAARAEFQRLLRRKQRHYTRSQATALLTLAQDNPARFWKKFKPPKKRACSVSDADMLAYFRDLLGQPPIAFAVQEGSTADCGAAPPAADGSELNVAFTAAAVAQGIDCLKGGKSIVGALKPDALSAASAELAPTLAVIFNACQRLAALPRQWALCGITPIHKGGDLADPGNFRGIAVGSLLAKLYAALLGERLMEWTERHGLRARGQAGFRKDHRTTDQVFVLRTLIESSRSSKQPLYTCYVDFKKAYDTIPRDLLWLKLQRIGVHGDFLHAMQALYATVPMGVQFADGMSSTFESLLGVKQGCPLSPTLFGIFIDDFQAELETGSAAFALPTLAGVQTPALLYADDLALVSTSTAGLQAQLDLLQVYSKRWRLTVNVKKTKVVVYTRPRSKVPPPQLTYMADPIEVLASFRYLGVDMHSTQPFAAAAADRAAAAQRAAFALHNRCHDLGLHDPALMLHLFDALVRPVMLYGVETWGPGALCGRDMEACEVVHRQFLRRLLGVRAGTPCVAVLGEVGRFPMAHTAAMLLCRYWNRLVAMPDTRPAKQAFLENVSLASSNRGHVRSACWATQVVSFLHFMSPIVDGVPQHIDRDAASAVLQRRHFEEVNNNDGRKVHEWRQIRGALGFGDYEPAVYLQAVTSRANRIRLTQFRTGSHWLGVESGRWQGLKREQRHCKRCNGGSIDDSAHMIWGCPTLIDQRLQHSELFSGSQHTVEEFLQQEPIELALFLRHCHDQCAELEDWGSS